MNSTNDSFGHAYWTFRTGTRTFDGVEMLLESVIDNFQKITNHPCGSFSDTNDLICRNAISTITMSYALLEGFLLKSIDII